MNDVRLYVITGENYHPGRSVAEVIEEALRGGADCIQLRDKEASKAELMEKAQTLRELTRRYNVPFIVNDYLDVALACDADGVHLGQEDLPLAEARRILGPDRIIGISTHNIDQARTAQKDGADYIGVGPVFPTGTKPGRAAVTTSYVSEAAAEITIPFVAIGGITLDNVDHVLQAGASRICAVSAIVGSRNVEATTRDFLSRIVSRSNGAIDSSLLRVTVNGKQVFTRSQNVGQLVQSYELHNKRIVVELDGAVVNRDEWDQTQLRHEAVVELVHFVAGG
ncbi:thiamine phosphate synthase [Paenibacillus beijingensis]|uniref:Thiamine-phosphate synthase n=1 Tax=Paenibacillus beijingensis TaxID=1126833 RepID=A0A0D5NQ94_9BACL|nr:thiamine-phosphate pyrophosphorylase [Paenibacillus beijingensis]